MIEVDTGRFTVGVFQDVAWAQKGLEALKQAGLLAESMTILAKESPDVSALIERTLGAPQASSSFPAPAPSSLAARSSCAPKPADLAKLGLAGTMRRVGFQAHDGRIFEALTARGGVLVAGPAASRALPTRSRFFTRTAAATPR